MPTDKSPPTAVLGTRFRRLLAGRRVTAGVFLTYTIEPDFFEQEILPLLSPQELSQDPRLKQVQLEEQLRSDIGPLSVFYDRGGLRGVMSPRLDVRYVPVAIPTGAFHPKMIILVTEPSTADSEMVPSLVCGVLSANLTKNGWWSCLEAAHFEELVPNSVSGCRDDLVALLGAIRRLASRDEAADPVERIVKWIRKNNVAQAQQSSINGQLRPRLCWGPSSFLKFTETLPRGYLNECSLEIISPFFESDEPRALRELQESLEPTETRVFLPRADDGSALCTSQLFNAIRLLPGTSWAKLPEVLLKLGKDKLAVRRGVHAKVYRFTRLRPRFEAILVGSHNLTSAALRRGGNFEASFLIERDSSGADQWWLDVESHRPSTFSPDPTLAEEEAWSDAVIPLQICYDWLKRSAECRWDGATNSPSLQVKSQGATLFDLQSVGPGEWHALTEGQAHELERILKSTAFVTVVIQPHGPEGTVLVQEIGMSRKPSLVINFTVTDIIEYWSRLSPEQQAEFLEAHFRGQFPEGDLETVLSRPPQRTKGFFDTYAGLFHGFEMLRQRVIQAVSAEKDAQADYLLFGERHDSLPRLIARIESGEDGLDNVTRYLSMLCAHQLLGELRRRSEPYYGAHRAEFDALITKARNTEQITSQLQLGEGGGAYLQWIEKHFLPRAVQRTDVAHD